MGAYENQRIASCKWDTASAGGAPPPDGNVGTPDFLLLLDDWGSCPGCGADFNCDLVVNNTDFLDLLAHWGCCPLPCQPQGDAPSSGGGIDGPGTGLTLEDALWAIGFLSVEDYMAWLEQATEEEVYTTAQIIAALLGG